eukprot:scaffold3050_cov99-Isochrysis_galbana.AAC.6
MAPSSSSSAVQTSATANCCIGARYSSISHAAGASSGVGVMVSRELGSTAWSNRRTRPDGMPTISRST